MRQNRRDTDEHKLQKRTGTGGNGGNGAQPIGKNDDTSAPSVAYGDSRQSSQRLANNVCKPAETIYRLADNICRLVNMLRKPADETRNGRPNSEVEGETSNIEVPTLNVESKWSPARTE